MIDRLASSSQPWYTRSMETPIMKQDDDQGQFGRDARKHLRTTDQAAMKRTGMDVKPGQMRLFTTDDALSRGEVRGFVRTATAIQRNAHLNTEPQNPKHQERAASNFGKVAGEVVKKKGSNPELAGTYARAAAHHGKEALGQDETDSDYDGGHGEQEEPSHYESAMSRKTGASVGQLRLEQAAAERGGVRKLAKEHSSIPAGERLYHRKGGPKK